MYDYVSMYVRTYVRTYVCMYVCMSITILICRPSIHISKMQSRYDKALDIALMEAHPGFSKACEAETSESVGWQNFGKMLLVFGCIRFGSDFCKKICVLQHFSKSARFSNCNF